jgi:hypothetical protein
MAVIFISGGTGRHREKPIPPLENFIT